MTQTATMPDGAGVMVFSGHKGLVSAWEDGVLVVPDGGARQYHERTGGDEEFWPSMAAARAALWERYRGRMANHRYQALAPESVSWATHP